MSVSFFHIRLPEIHHSGGDVMMSTRNNSKMVLKIPFLRQLEHGR